MEETVYLQISGLCLSARIARQDISSLLLISVVVMVFVFVFDDVVDVIVVVCNFCGCVISPQM